MGDFALTHTGKTLKTGEKSSTLQAISPVAPGESRDLKQGEHRKQTHEWTQRMKKLIIICGISFAGKSTLGKAIAERFNYAEVDVDDVKYQLYGPAIQDEELSREDWDRIYAETDHLLERYLILGKTVIDASRNFRKEERQWSRHIATQQSAEIVTIFVDTPEAVARQRLFENRKKLSRCDVTDKDFEVLLRVTEPPTTDEHPLVFHSGDQMEQWISRNVSVLS